MRKVLIVVLAIAVFCVTTSVAEVCDLVIWYGFENGLNDMATTGYNNDVLTTHGSATVLADPTGQKGGNVLRLMGGYADAPRSFDTIQANNWTLVAKFYSMDPAYHPGGWFDIFMVDNARLKGGGGVSGVVSTFGVISDSQPAGQSWQAPQGGWFNGSTDIHGSMWGMFAAVWEQRFDQNRTYLTVYIFDLAGNLRFANSAYWTGIHTSSDWMDGVRVLASDGKFPNGIYLDDLCVFNGSLTIPFLTLLSMGEDPHLVANPNPEYPRLIGPRDGGLESNGWMLDWQAGNAGPYTYDVFLGTDYDAVLNSTSDGGACPPNYPAGDFNQDCKTDMDDLLLLASSWLGSPDYSHFALLGEGWQSFNMLAGSTSETEFWHSNLGIGETYYWRVEQDDGVETLSSEMREFTVVPEWTHDEFVIFIGWPEIHQCSNKPLYVQRLADMGINCVHDAESVLDLCYSNGIDVMIYRDPSALATLAYQYKDHPGNWGYFTSDEPDDSEVPFVALFHQANHWADPTHPSYSNIQSINYGVSRSYVYNFVDTVRPEILSFDFYHWYWHKFWNGYPTLVENLDFFRQVALDNQIPLFSWVEVDANSSGGTENRERHRYSVYLNLTYGVKGIMWFTGSEIFDSSTGSIINQGYYDDVQAMNAELANLGPELIGLTSTAVYHTGIDTVSGDDGAYMDPIPGGHWVQIDQNGFALGMFQNASGDDYAMVMNRDKDNAHTATVRFQTAVSTVDVFNEQTGVWQSMTVFGSPGNQYVQLSIGGGYGKLFRIN